MSSCDERQVPRTKAYICKERLDSLSVEREIRMLERCLPQEAVWLRKECS
jgi:hypothetical protein